LEFVPVAAVSDRGYKIALAGKHQQQNAALAVAALGAGEVALTAAAIARGLAEVEWPARFQRWDKRIVIDGAHNPAGAEILAETWREQFGSERATIVLAVLREKNVEGICRALAPIAARFILPHIRTERALLPDELAQTFASITAKGEPGSDLRHSIAASLPAALESARAFPERILITGSLHFAGEVLATLNGNPDALEDCTQ
jgi:dihydrofolate synthase/folylpolyglutamate synthase